MISPEYFVKKMKEYGVDFFAGVPDSLLKNFCAYIDDQDDSSRHIITANEGNAVALASGYHLATGKVPVVYMQNSGLGNTVNPLTSLTDSEVYKIPMLLVIGWRGEPGTKDEPQHVKQGKITEKQLELLSVPYYIVDGQCDIDYVLEKAFQQIYQCGSPVALLVRKNSFDGYKSEKKIKFKAEMKRECALRKILSSLKADDVIVSTTGKTSRELFELRVERQEENRDFLTVGGMGHTSSIAMGVALGQSEKRVICIDGDGSALMHFGALPIIGNIQPKNLVHILLNNSAHESVGGQATVAGELDFKVISLASGYNHYFFADSEESITSCFDKISMSCGPIFVEVKITTGSRKNLGRPTSTPEENKRAFMKAVQL